MARLAGFFTCAQLVLQSKTTSSELVELHHEICKLDVDGFLITPAARTPELAKEAGRLCRRLLGWRWSLLSSLLDAGESPVSTQTSLNPAPLTGPDSRQDNFGEGAEA
jgi:hypothetical protein